MQRITLGSKNFSIFFLLLFFVISNPSFALEPYVNPIMSARLSSKYGTRIHPIKKYSHSHPGIDLAAPFDSPIRAIMKGRVVFADKYAGYGNLVVIQHENGMTSHYGHCSKIVVQPGTYVKTGEIIARIGSTGVSTGPHLHLEIRFNGIPKNPLDVYPNLLDVPKG